MESSMYLTGSLKPLSKDLSQKIREPMVALKVRVKRTAKKMKRMRRKKKKQKKALVVLQRLKSAKLLSLMVTIS